MSYPPRLGRMTLLGILALLLGTFSRPAISQRHYVITRQLKSTFFTFEDAWGLNNYGDISGRITSNAFTSAGVFKFNGDFYGAYGDFNSRLGTPIAYGVNDSGAVVGADLGDIGNYSHAFRNPGSGGTNTTTFLTGLTGDPPYASAVAFGINNAGLIVGASASPYGDAFFNYPHATLWSNGVATDLDGRTTGLNVSYAQAINNSGQVTGYAYFPTGDGNFQSHAFLWNSNTGMQDLGTPGLNSAYYLSQAFAISEDNRVVGTWSSGDFADGSIRHAFYYDGTMQDIGILPGFSYAFAVGVNSRGQVVGWVVSNPAVDNDVNRQGYSGFLWENGVMTELTNLVNNSTLHWHPVGINERGEIAAKVDERSNAQNLSGALLTPEAVEVTSQVRASASGLVYNRATRQYSGNVVITNTGPNPIYGPLQLELSNLPAGATLTNQAGTHNGHPFVYFNNVIKLLRGQSVTVPVVLTYTGNARLGYSVKTYTGAFAQ